ncbi:complement factor H-like [Notolabrus celidotus]|uniref:complement factor H-like n=1 Tax=Notolabrus celidotus TaxID=1203425 RepID=UPI00148F447A|nr:complement factor H-like [Notolabrus celidotus]
MTELCFVLVVLIPDKMCMRCLRCVLLVCFSGLLYAQNVEQHCPAPSLDGGYFLPKQDTYYNESTIIYACENRLKPAVEGWWSTSACQNGKWIPEPQCIDEKACVPLTVTNAKNTENSNSWFKEGEKIRITCMEGYELKNWDATAVCLNGTWSSVPICERSNQSCSEPPIIPHAVIVGQTYQELFALDSKVNYECEDGYAVEGAESEKTIVCINGGWTAGPTCIRKTRPGTGHGQGGATGGRHEGDTTFAGRAPRPVAIRNCGRYPLVPNGEVFGYTDWFLKYSCNSFYKLEGQKTVMCYSDGSWSRAPTCKVAFCSVDTDQYPELVDVGLQYLKDGEKVEFECVKKSHWWFDHYSVAKCTDGILMQKKCCNRIQLNTRTCSGCLTRTC